MLATVVLLIYAGLFVFYTYRSGLKQWLFATVVLALASLWLLSNLAPGMVYHHGMGLLYLLPMWVCLGSLFFFVNQWRYHSGRQVFYAEPVCPPYAVYLAVSGMMLNLAWLIPVLWSSFQYPDGLSFYSMMGLLQLYFLQPVYWILVQWTLMLMLHLAQKWHHTPVLIISIGQLQFAFLFGLIAVSVYVVKDLAGYLLR